MLAVVEAVHIQEQAEAVGLAVVVLVALNQSELLEQQILEVVVADLLTITLLLDLVVMADQE
jgi:hypothetical protein